MYISVSIFYGCLYMDPSKMCCIFNIISKFKFNKVCANFFVMKYKLLTHFLGVVN